MFSQLALDAFSHIEPVQTVEDMSDMRRFRSYMTTARAREN